MIKYIPFRWAGRWYSSTHVQVGPPLDYAEALEFKDKNGCAHGLDATELTEHGPVYWFDVKGPVLEAEYTVAVTTGESQCHTS